VYELLVGDAEQPLDDRAESRFAGGSDPLRAFLRRQQSLGRTWLRRPELLERLSLDKTDRALLEAFQAEWRASAAGEVENP
jgi:hypothetical protein